MIILRPYETQFLPRVPREQWREPSRAVQRDQMGNLTTQTRFRIRARANDGGVIWCGWLDDRDDFDAFLWALATGSLHHERPLWDLPTPMWPGLDPSLSYDFATVTFLTTTGSNQTYTKPADWNNADNLIECLGAASGPGSTYGNGGGGGAYTKLLNVTLTGDATYRVGAASAGDSNAEGGDTWFNDSAYPTTGSNKVGAKGGQAARSNYVTTPGGASASGYPATGSTRYSGGAGGAGNPSGYGGAGGGGAAGKNGAGNTATNCPASNAGTAGGSGDAGFGGSAGAANTNAAGSAGGAGTEWDASHGSGGGGGGGSGTSPSYNGGAGGDYGAGGGAGGYPSGASGASKQGLIVVTYTPGAAATSLICMPPQTPFMHMLVR